MIPRVILILCEGLTEKLYFDSVVRNKRIARVLSVEVLGKQGQHKALIKKCTEKRKNLAEELGIDEKDIEVWAVCDRDNLKIGYQKLLNYALKNNVELAFSDPQFETYLVQHFEYKRITTKQEQLEADLSAYLGVPYNKANLDWFDKMIDEDPAKLNQAVLNSNRLDNHTKPPFLTVQKLKVRLLELSK